MAFNPENRKITDAVKQTPNLSQNTEKKDLKAQQAVFSIPKIETENTKTYTFTMKPKIRKRLNELAKSHGFKSDSSFLSYLIEHVE